MSVDALSERRSVKSMVGEMGVVKSYDKEQISPDNINRHSIHDERLLLEPRNSHSAQKLDEMIHHHHHHKLKDGRNSIEDIDEEALMDDDEDLDVNDNCCGDDDEENDDDESVGDEDDEDDEIDEEEDDYCTDESIHSSSASSSSSTTIQPDSTRVCDCCYCEVFGHGTSNAAPTSRNFHEMRERLRRRLSKRQEQNPKQQVGSTPDKTGENEGRGCNKDAGDNFDRSTNTKQSSQHKKRDYAIMGESTIEEILKFINGTKKSNDNRRKDKNKTNSGNTTTATTITNNNNNTGNSKKNKNTKSSVITTTHHSGNKDTDKCHDTNNSSNNNPSHLIRSHSPTLTKQQNRQNHQHHSCGVSTNSGQQAAKINRPNLDHHSNQMVKNFNEKQHKVRQDSTMTNNNNNDSNCKQSNGKYNLKNNLRPPAISTGTLLESKKNQDKISDRRSLDSVKSASIAPVMLTNKNSIEVSSIQSCQPKQNIESKASNNKTTNAYDDNHNINNDHKHTTLKENRGNSNGPTIGKSMKNKTPSKPNKDLDINVLPHMKPEDVFKPSDIDLDNVEIDEFERELETFKRFCFDSVPAKERLRVELKDASWFQKLSANHGQAENHSKSYQSVHFNGPRKQQNRNRHRGHTSGSGS